MSSSNSIKVGDYVRITLENGDVLCYSWDLKNFRIGRSTIGKVLETSYEGLIYIKILNGDGHEVRNRPWAYRNPSGHKIKKISKQEAFMELI